MKHVLILIVLGFFLLFIGIYILDDVSPFLKDPMIDYASNQEYLTDNQLINSIDSIIDKGLIFRMLDWKNITVFFLVYASSFISFFASIHISIDKFFFKKFYQPPNYFAAYRRGILISVIFIGLFFLRLINILDWYNALAIIALVILIEVFTMGIIREKSIKNNKNISQNEYKSVIIQS